MRRTALALACVLALIGRAALASTTVYSTVIASLPTSATLQSAATATGNGTAVSFTGSTLVEATVVWTVECTVSCSGTTIQFQAEDASGNWTLVDAVQQPGASNSTVISSVTPSGVVTEEFRSSISGFAGIRAPISAYSAGTVTVLANVMPINGYPSLVKLDPSNLGFGTAGSPSSQVQSVQGVSGGTPLAGNITQWDSSALGAPSNYGTSPGAVAVPGVNAYVTNTPTVDIKGNAGAPLDAAIGGGSVTNALAVGGIYNTSAPTPSAGQSVALQTDSSGNLKISSDNITTTDGSIYSSGVSAGSLVLGSVTTSAPTYTTGQQKAVSMDTAGDVRVALPGAASDACQASAHTFTPFSFSSTTSQLLVSGVSGKKTYICSLTFLPITTATNVAIIEGTTTTNPCDTSAAGVIGGATTGTGAVMVASEGFALGDGMAAVAATATNADNLCLLASASNQISGVIVTAKQ